MRRKVLLLTTLATVIALGALGGFVAITKASPPVGVTPTLLARGTYPGFNVRSNPRGPIANYRVHSTDAIDLVVRKHDYAPGSWTGWHAHPGPVFITVTQGQLTYYHYDDPTCSPHVVNPGQGFMDDGPGHIVRNESGQPAQDISVIAAPVGGAFRTELDAPGPHCNF